MMQTLAGADWLNARETRAVIAALEAARPGCARFVGGCVRNTLMGRAVDDIDIATQLKPEETIKALGTAGIRSIPTGIEHGTVTAIVDHVPFEITSLRRDVETDGRRAVVAFTQDWAEDAQRRDFRLNAIYADGNGNLYDPTGGGLEDVAAGRVIFIGDADERLREDYLRILRFFRFNAWYGCKIDADGLAACARQKDGLKKIAVERIWKEFKKLLGAPEASFVITPMAQAGVLEEILPEWRGKDQIFDQDTTPAGYLEDVEDSETNHELVPDPMQRFMALLPHEEPVVRAVCSRLKLSNSDRDRLVAWSQVDPDYTRYQTLKGIRAEEYRMGRQAVIDWAIWMILHTPLEYYKTAGELPRFPLKGEDLVKAGLKPGPAVGQLLKALEAWWIEGDFRADKAALLEELERRLKAD